MGKLLIVTIILALILVWDQIIIKKLRADRNIYKNRYFDLEKKVLELESQIENEQKNTKITRDITKF